MFVHHTGMHDNANITCAQNETYEIFDVLQSLQPRSTGGEGGGLSREDQIIAAVSELLFVVACTDWY
jgi:dynein heavy chain